MKDLWIFVDEVEAIIGRQRNCFSWSIIDANRMQDSLKNLMKMEINVSEGGAVSEMTVLIFISCTILLFATIGRVIITNVNTFCKLQVSLDKSDFIHFFVFSPRKNWI